MIERGTWYCAIVTPDSDSQSARFNDLNCVIEADRVIGGTGLRAGICQGGIGWGFTLVLVSKAHDFDVAEPKLPDQTLKHHQTARPFDSIVVEMGVSRKNDVNSDNRKIRQEPLWANSRCIIPPGIGQNGQARRRYDLEGIVSIELEPDIAWTSGVSTMFLNRD